MFNYKLLKVVSHSVETCTGKVKIDHEFVSVMSAPSISIIVDYLSTLAPRGCYRIVIFDGRRKKSLNVSVFHFADGDTIVEFSKNV